MNTTSVDDHTPEADVAGEFVLGVLDAAAREAVKRRLRDDAALAADVQRWENRLSPLFDEIVGVVVPERIWASIREAIRFGTPRSSTSASPTTSGGWWDSAGFWRGVSGLAVAASIALAVALGTRVPPAPVAVPEPAPTPMPTTAVPMAATLAGDDGRPGFVAALDPQVRRLTVTPLADPPANDRVQELWIIPKGGRPVSLGLLDPRRTQAHSLDESLLRHFGDEALLAVTLEPLGGAPGGIPSGPVIAKGQVARL